MKTIVKFLKAANGSAGRRMMLVLFAAALSLGASAQRGVHYSGGGSIHGGGGAVVHGGGYHGGGYHGRVVYAYPRSYFGLGLGLGFGYGYGFGPWSFYGPMGWGYYPYPPFYYGYGAMPTELSQQIADIKSDYNAQIKDVKHDKTIPRKERKDKVNQLKQDRDAAVIQARHDYFDAHYRRRNSNGPQPYNGNDGQPQQQQKDQKPVSGNDGPEYQNGQSSAGGTTTQE
ncbi:MAG TPA: hypothetical protein VGM31_23405 [Puia sp.]